MYVIQNKNKVDFLSLDYDFQACQIVGENNKKIRFDLLKLSTVSPLIKSILDSFGLPLFVLGRVDIILPDSSIEELRTLQHLMASDDGDSLCLSKRSLTKLQSLLDVLNCRIDNTPSPGHSQNDSDELQASTDGNENMNYDQAFDLNLSGKERKKDRLVSILKSSQNQSWKPAVDIKSIFSQPEHVKMHRNIQANPKPSSTRTFPDPRYVFCTLKPEDKKSETPDASTKFKIMSENGKFSRLKPLQPSNNGNLFAAKRSNSHTGSVGRRQLQSSLEVRAKPMPLSKKVESLSRSDYMKHMKQAAPQSHQVEQISDSQKFQLSKLSRSGAGGHSRIKLDNKITGRCGKCTNCEINKQIKRCGRCSACMDGLQYKQCVHQLKCLKSESE